MYVHAHAPVRVEIAGGATDLPAWTSRDPGLCLNLAIDKYCHAVAVERAPGVAVASYSRLEVVRAAEEIENGLIRESAISWGWMTGFEVHTIAEVSSRGSGLGASSSIAVALAALFSRMARSRRGEATEGPDAPAEAARAAWEVEIDRLHRPIGRQDHMAAAWGGLRLYRFEGDGAAIERSFSYEEARWVADRVVVVRLPVGHDAGAILSGVTYDQIRPSFDAVQIACQAVEERSVARLREAFALAHAYKMRVHGSVTPDVAEVVRRVRQVPGVCGATVAGAGGGGHVVAFFADAVTDDDVRRVCGETSLPAFRVVPDVLGVRSEVWR